MQTFKFNVMNPHETTNLHKVHNLLKPKTCEHLFHKKGN